MVHLPHSPDLASCEFCLPKNEDCNKRNSRNILRTECIVAHGEYFEKDNGYQYKNVFK